MFVQTKEYILPDPSFTTHNGHTLFCEKCFVVWEAIATKSEPVDILLLTTEYLHALQDFAVKLSFCLCNFQWRVRHMSMKQQPLLIGWSVTVKVWYILICKTLQNHNYRGHPWPKLLELHHIATETWISPLSPRNMNTEDAKQHIKPLKTAKIFGCDSLANNIYFLRDFFCNFPISFWHFMISVILNFAVLCGSTSSKNPVLLFQRCRFLSSQLFLVWNGIESSRLIKPSLLICWVAIFNLATDSLRIDTLSNSTFAIFGFKTRQCKSMRVICLLQQNYIRTTIITSCISWLL